MPLDPPLTVLGLPDWSTDAPEALVRRFVADAYPRTDIKLALGVPSRNIEGSTFERRIASLLESLDLAPTADFPDLELFESPTTDSEWKACLARASILWTAGATLPDLASRGKELDRLQASSLEGLALALWLAEPVGPEDLVPYDPSDLRAFWDDMAAIRVLRFRFERTNSGAHCDTLVYSPALRRRMMWQFLAIEESDGVLRLRLPAYLSEMPANLQDPFRLAVLESWSEVLADPAYERQPIVVVEVPDGELRASDAGDGRVTPGYAFNELFVHSAKRYRMAQHLCQSKTVLDLSCGSGYGTRLLAKTAHQVTGCDVDPEAVAYGEEVYPAPNVERKTISLIRASAPLPFETGSFDAVTNFEVIEHVPWPEMEAFFSEIKRVLRPDGTLIVSTPNKTIYRNYPDPNHVSLMTAPEFDALLKVHFADVAMFSQVRSGGSGDVFAEFDIVSGADDRREIFLAVCRGPRSEPRPFTLEGRSDALRILVFNWHEPYLALLARTGHRFDVGDWMPRADGMRSWDPRKRPVPANMNLVHAEETIRANLAAGSYDLVVCQTPYDLAVVGDAEVPVLYLTHNAWHADYHSDLTQGEQVRRQLHEHLTRRGALFASISTMKLESWQIPGLVIPPGIDVRDYPLGSHERPETLTVGVMLRARPIFDHAFLEQVTTGFPHQVFGFNPDLEGVDYAKSWQELITAFGQARVYVHATAWPYEDGYNLALLEAMACGSPVVALAGPNVPIEDGVTGFVGTDPASLRQRVKELLADLDLARKLGRAARETVRERFGLEPFVSRWNDAFLAAREQFIRHRQSHARASSGRGSALRPRILLAISSNAISTSAYFERAFRQDCDVVTVGPVIDRATLGQWKQVTDQHALKPPGSGDQKMDLIARVSRPCDIPWPKGQASIPEILAALPAGWTPDLLVWIDNYFEMMPTGFEHLPCPSACLIGDTHTQMDWRIEYARNFDHVFVMFNRQHIGVFRQAGCRNVEWLPAACDPDIHICTGADKAYDVGFVGQTLRQWHPDRVRLLERLQEAGFDVHIDTKILQEMALVFNRSRIILNRSLKQDLNMRVFEALSTGSLLLTDRLPAESGLELLFKDREQLVLYDEDNLEQLVAYYLEHPEERERTAARGRTEALAHHTYRHRVRQILAAVGLSRPDTDGEFEQHPALARKPTADRREAGDGSPLASIVIPLFNKADFTRQCLEAIEASSGEEIPYEVVLVDNGSTDGTRELLGMLEGDVKILRNESNLGFAAACNQGARLASGKYLIFLNNDTVPQPGWLSALVRSAHADATIGVVGCKLLYPGSGLIQHAGMDWADGTPDHPFRHAAPDLPEVSTPRDLDMVTGACMLVRRELFEGLGGFDEGYRNGCEDVDLCLSAREAGYRVRYEPASVLFHHEGTSEGRFAHVQANLIRLRERWGHRFDAEGRFLAEAQAL